MDQAVSDFNEIRFQPLRVFNRCVVLFNINEDRGEDAARKYLAKFTDEEKAQMIDMYETVKIYGADVVRKDIMKNMPLQEDEVDEGYGGSPSPLANIQISLPHSPSKGLED